MSGHKYWLIAIFTAAVLFSGNTPAISARDWMISVNGSFSSGHYGTTTLFNDLFIPLSLRRFFPWGSVEISVPFVSSTAVAPQSGGGGGGGPIRGLAPQQSRFAPGTALTGAGDVRLRGRYYLGDEFDGAPLTTALSAGIKFPTADSASGLGTGAMDGRVGLEFSKDLTRNIYGILDVGYTIVGTSPTYALINQWDVAVGAGFEWSKSVSSTLTYVEESPPINNVANFKGVYGSLNYWLDKNQRLKLEVGAGLSTQAPDYSAGLGWSTLF